MFQSGDIVTCSCDPGVQFRVISSYPGFTIVGTGPDNNHTASVRTSHLTLVEDWFEAWVSQVRAENGLT